MTINLAPYIGKSYRPGGRGPDFYDCYGLVLAIYREIGIYLPEYATPFTDEAAAVDRLVTENRWHFTALEKPEAWAIVAFADGHFPTFVTHLGVVLDDTTRFIHARRGADICAEGLFSPLWNRRRRGLYRWNN